MFNQLTSRLEKKRLFENRVWQKGEAFDSYCHDKVILENKVPIDEEEIVIIDGILSMNFKEPSENAFIYYGARSNEGLPKNYPDVTRCSNEPSKVFRR